MPGLRRRGRLEEASEDWRAALDAAARDARSREGDEKWETPEERDADRRHLLKLAGDRLHAEIESARPGSRFSVG